MTVHIKKRHLYKIRYPCEICPNKSWRTLFQLQRHVKVFHHNIREFKCEWCGKEFGEKNKLVCHVRIHTGKPSDTLFTENLSTLLFFRRTAIQMQFHWLLESVHSSNWSSATCLGSRKLWEVLIWSSDKKLSFQTGERPYKCQNQTCLKGFMKKSELTAHESRCHPAVRPSLPLPFQYQMM